MNNKKRFELAADVLSERLCNVFMQMDSSVQSAITEIRLRADKQIIVTVENNSKFISASGKLTEISSELNLKTDTKEIVEIFKRMCGYSVHSFTETINRGYVTVPGGHRAGVAGTAVTEKGRVISVRDINCINLRIAREIKGSADSIYNEAFSDGISSLIIAGPPSSGKTTVLRDLARQLSGAERGKFFRTLVCDERNEIGANVFGTPQNDLGINCDLLSCYPKGEGILIGLRSFSPDIIICDEIATDEEADAIETGLNSGVNFIVSVHAKNEAELKSKKLIRRLARSGAFEKIILLSSETAGKTEKIFRVGELFD